MPRRRLIHPGKGLSARRTLADLRRFLKFVEEREGHWIWTGRVDGNGYGQFKFRGQARGAHRVSYLLFKGRIRNGNDIDHNRHKCDVSRCVHPEHLRQMTRHANSAEGGRYSNGGGGILNPHHFNDPAIFNMDTRAAA